MEKQFCSYEIAKRLKELGFNEPCFTKFDDLVKGTLYPILCTFSLNGPYENEYNGYDQKIINDTEKHWHFTGYKNAVKDHGNEVLTAPLWQQCVEWLRTERKIHCSIFAMFENEDSYKTCWGWNVLELEWGDDKEHHIASSVHTQCRNLTYEQAREAAITKALTLIK